MVSVLSDLSGNTTHNHLQLFTARMANFIKALVSKNKKRHTEGEFNLDLSYITEQIIAMGYPANKLEGVYRNNIEDVVKFLDQKHADKYKVYNLCRERSYDILKFHNRVKVYPFEDHNPPALHLIPKFCEDVHEWLALGPLYVAAVHCKAGKGRTGVMICCYLLHASYRILDWQINESVAATNEHVTRPLTADEVLELYDSQRTKNYKGVTIPSQKRYVHYYSYQLRHNIKVCEAVPLRLITVKLHGGIPTASNTSSCTAYLEVHTMQCLNDDSAACPVCSLSDGTLHLAGVTGVVEARRGATETVLFPAEEVPLVVTGDVKVTLYNKPKLMKKEKLFQAWFNTYFVLNQLSQESVTQSDSQTDAHFPHQRSNGDGASSSRLCPPSSSNNSNGFVNTDQSVLTLTLSKDQLDKAIKDKTCRTFPATFKVTLTFERARPEDFDRAAAVPSRLYNDEEGSDDLDSDPPSPRLSPHREHSATKL